MSFAPDRLRNGHFRRVLESSFLLGLLLVCVALSLASAQAQEPGPLPEAADPQPKQAAPEAQAPAPSVQQPAQEPVSTFDKAIFGKPVPIDQLRFLGTYANAPTGELYQDRQFRKLMKSFVPDCMFHYGRDMPLTDALDKVLAGSREPVQIRNNRYVLLSGFSGPYLGGRGFLWLDLQDGLGLGAFFFQPTNGEPTPTLAVFSRQVKESTLALSKLPPAFVEDLNQWTVDARIATITTRYFLNGTNKRILLEHDEDFCALGDGTLAPPGSGCEQMNADAADTDETAAYYLEQIHYATNGTAWTIGPDQVAWLQVRETTCGSGPDLLACRIRVTREHTHRIIGLRPVRR